MGYRDGSLVLLSSSKPKHDGFHPDPKLQQRKLWDWPRTLWLTSRVSVLFKIVYHAMNLEFTTI